MAGRLVPKYERHAIAQASFATEWEQPLDDALFKQILDRHGLIAADLPRKQIGRSVYVQIGGPPTPPPAAARQADISSLTFDRVGPDGEPSWVLIVNPTLVSVTCSGRAYTRWSEVWTAASRYLQFVLEVVMPVRPVTIVGLQYVDEFLWETGDRDEFTADKLFQRSRHLPPMVFDITGLWHAHSGFYLAGDEPVRHRTLNNVNVNVVDAPSKVRAVQIVMAHRLILHERLTRYSEDLFATRGLVAESMRRLHDLDKEVLRSLLLPAMTQQIHLDEQV